MKKIILILIAISMFYCTNVDNKSKPADTTPETPVDNAPETPVDNAPDVPTTVTIDDFIDSKPEPIYTYHPKHGITGEINIRSKTSYYDNGRKKLKIVYHNDGTTKNFEVSYRDNGIREKQTSYRKNGIRVYEEYFYREDGTERLQIVYGLSGKIAPPDNKFYSNLNGGYCPISHRKCIDSDPY